MRLFILKFTKRQLRFPLVFIVFMYQSLKCSMILIFIYISTISYEAEQFMNSNLTETLHKTWVWQKAKPYQVSAQYSNFFGHFLHLSIFVKMTIFRKTTLFWGVKWESTPQLILKSSIALDRERMELKMVNYPGLLRRGIPLGNGG